jgi:hemerythrin-like metal-binding protein
MAQPMISPVAQPVSWDEHHRMGVDPLDREHQALFDCYRQLTDADIPSSDAAAMGIAALEAHAATHFAHEEAVMIDSRYPYYVHHKRDHEAFLVELHQLKTSFEAGDDILDALRRFLKDWLASHIAIRDRGLAAHLRDLTPAAD